MIGYYVHHHGQRPPAPGHRWPAACRVGGPVTGLSSLPRPPSWPGRGSGGPLDDDADGPTPADVDARAAACTGCRWARRAALAHGADLGLDRRRRARGRRRRRVGRGRACSRGCTASRSSRWSLPGPPRRPRPPARLRRRRRARRLLAAAGEPGCCAACPPTARARVEAVGALSRFPVASRPATPVVRAGAAWCCCSGSGRSRPRPLAARPAQSPGWDWTVLGRDAGTWVDDPSAPRAARPTSWSPTPARTRSPRSPPRAARRSSCPQERPARRAARHRGARWPGRVAGGGARRRGPPAAGRARLDAAAASTASGWAAWCDGGAAGRASPTSCGHVRGP